MRLIVNHRTVYQFEPAVKGLTQSHRLNPASFVGQQVQRWSVDIPGASVGAGFRDGAGDWVQTITLPGPLDAVEVVISGEVETEDTSGVLKGHKEKVPPGSYLRSTRATRADRTIEELAAQAVRKVDLSDGLGRAHALCHAVAEAVAYTPGQTEHGTTAPEAVALGHGVCQDHGHVLISAAHTLGLPARYVTGYLFATDETQGYEASHAWAEIAIPALGWVGFDPSNQSCPDERYIRLGSGADADEAAPIRGVAQGQAAESLDVSVAVSQAAQ